ncbi:MAG TPA: hypothetical protein VKP14_07890, partial [Gaiellaceae bacterium]|nr:hypothetical protein [Gaiellaceae bacterium]
AASPVAFLLLVVVLAGIALGRRSVNWLPVAAVVLAGAIEVVLWRLFPGGGRYPFSLAEFAAGAAFCVLGVVFSWRVPMLRYLFAVYLVALVSAYIIPSAVGENIARLRYAAIPLAVLVLSLRKWKPLVPCLTVLVLALSWNLTPLAQSYIHGSADTTAQQSEWPSTIAFLRAHLGSDYRVEAVDTSAHWPAVYLADADIPLARGWFRQDDFPQNQLLYSKLGARAYDAWLRGLGVRYVVVTTAPPDYSARAEAALVRSGRAGLVPVFSTARISVYEVPHARPIVTGPASPSAVSLTQARIGVSVHAGGLYRIAVRYSPYWRASDGCLSQGSDGMLRLQTRAARNVTIVFAVNASRALDQLAGERPSCTLR